ncbi:hypothetical protein [Sandaracinus amylolyticus]|uniref:Uncharacterized protein n=1 Tax=Sandaracinus amylolyticus TaxID=927083 RepID=A0A0F6W718_9BACT|nr:hypothetical protein [Sandaracinus amylolyticus]AKF08915.1 Hypothetical protein DB32_006064 [Sandaracinus amylolyticus]
MDSTTPHDRARATVIATLITALVVGCEGELSDPDEARDAAVPTRDGGPSTDAAIPADDAATDPDDAGERIDELRPDVVAIQITNAAGGAPAKGDTLRVTLTVENHGDVAGRVALVPHLTSARFADFTDVPLGTVEIDLGARARADATLEVGPFLHDAARGDRFALGRGDYTVSRVDVNGASDTEHTGGALSMAASNAMFVAVVYDPVYFDRLGYSGTPEAFLRDAFTRETEVFDPSSPGSSAGTYQSFPGGFDEMMNVRQLFHVLPGLAANDAGGGYCEQVGAYARAQLGLTRDWDVDERRPGRTDPDHHGFDMLVGLTQEMGGGAACGWLDVQVSGLFDFDLSRDRAQIILVHETGHLFGAPHCDPLQGYVMCAGEQHQRYRDRGVFVWHRVSLDAMTNRWD